MKGRKMRVTERALIQRVNRKLKPDLEQLKTTRSTLAELDVGRHYIIDHRRNFVTRKDVDIEEIARELGVLKDYEVVVAN